MKVLRVLLLVMVIGGSGAWWWLHNGREQQAANGQLVLYGNVDIRQVQLAFNDSERIDRMLVQEGDRVSKGQLVAALETSRLEAAVNSRQARVSAQEQVVARLEAGNRPEEIRKARADMDAARADMDNAQSIYRRVSHLVTRDLDSQQRKDDARAALDVAKSKLEAAKETYQLMILGPRKEDIAAARSSLDADRADLALAQRQLDDANLYAPSPGVIENRLLEPGDMASPQKPVYTLALDNPIWVRAYVAETDLGRIHTGMPARITTDSFPGKVYEGWIGYISPTAEFTPKTVETPDVRTRLVYQVRVFVRKSTDELRLGMPAVVNVPLDESDGAGASQGNPE